MSETDLKSGVETENDALHESHLPRRNELNPQETEQLNDTRIAHRSGDNVKLLKNISKEVQRDIWIPDDENGDYGPTATEPKDPSAQLIAPTDKLEDHDKPEGL